MLMSMTGYGRATSPSGLTVEIKSVNHRFIEVKVYLPRAISFLEIPIARYIREKVNRGSLIVSLSGATDELIPTEIHLNRCVLSAYLQGLKTVMQETKATLGDFVGPPSLAEIIDLEGVVETETTPNEGNIFSILKPLLDKALEGLITARRNEGKALQEVLSTIIASCEKHVENISAQNIGVADKIRAQLVETMKKILQENGMTVQEDRVVQEAAMIAERSDITEEIDRLKVHLASIRKLFNEEPKEGVGRKLDFIIQELNREANTIAAKTQSTPISLVAVNLRTEIEKAREQVQNVE